MNPVILSCVCMCLVQFATPLTPPCILIPSSLPFFSPSLTCPPSPHSSPSNLSGPSYPQHSTSNPQPPRGLVRTRMGMGAVGPGLTFEGAVHQRCVPSPPTEPSPKCSRRCKQPGARVIPSPQFPPYQAPSHQDWEARAGWGEAVQVIIPASQLSTSLW